MSDVRPLYEIGAAHCDRLPSLPVCSVLTRRPVPDSPLARRTGTFPVDGVA